MSDCLVLACAVCDKTIHHGTYAECQIASSYLVPFSVCEGTVYANTPVYYICPSCESEPIQKLVEKLSISCKNKSPCFYCDLCKLHSDSLRLHLRWGSWGKDLCSGCMATTSFRQYIDGCKSP